MNRQHQRNFWNPGLWMSLSLCLLSGCGGHHEDTGSDGSASSEAPVVHAVGNAASGKQMFRFETFSNERFCTDALRLQPGVMAAGVTPLQALRLGLMVDSDALGAATLATIAAKSKTDLSPANAPVSNNPATTIALINASAIIGIVATDRETPSRSTTC